MVVIALIQVSRPQVFWFSSKEFYGISYFRISSLTWMQVGRFLLTKPITINFPSSSSAEYSNDLPPGWIIQSSTWSRRYSPEIIATQSIILPSGLFQTPCITAFSSVKKLIKRRTRNSHPRYSVFVFSVNLRQPQIRVWIDAWNMDWEISHAIRNIHCCVLMWRRLA